VIKKKDLSKEDKKIWENYIKNPTDIFDKDNSRQFISKKKDRYSFDLHGFTLDDANKKVRQIIFSCIQRGFKEILLITGKGIHSTNEKDVYVSKDLGKLKYSVPEFIKSDQELIQCISSISEAEIKDGGKGAILIKLRGL
tara:strand:+ start:349 stop:768 length:420 start_codon:yes stop_codon:yes gene_type:complete